MKIDLKFTGILVAGAVATSALVVLATGSGDDPEDVPSGGDVVAGPSADVPAPNGTGPAGAGGGAGAGEPGGAQRFPLPTSTERISCPEPTVTVTDAVKLQEALNVAEPGTVIQLAPGTFRGRFLSQKSGARDRPIFVCGTPESVLDGGGTGEGYGFHLQDAAHWRLIGFTLQNSQKGVMFDGTEASVVQELTIRNIGDEAVHLRRFSTGNSVQYNSISRTGRENPRFGEGVYLGSSHNNWGTLTGGQPDRSDNNLVAGNKIRSTAEAVDVKEGTSGGRIAGNAFDGTELSGGFNDSWVDVKGNGYVVEDNRGAKTGADGFQTHEEYKGWGTRNVFRRNVIALGDAKGVGIRLDSAGNAVACDNRVSGGELLNTGQCS
ncbi:right-handed parallel beta-helix repeat-containing protein [Actinomadura rifamycini]|uniref:right-handed parallel beta-helix repeat-containing protein n=1 Tax=Actinomadura rifamycini TaxID=31962 RepID=UPI0003FF17D3|nr:right-handed parallel beta-helix repeat-containing protein [Actinomadura rifamycini]